PLLATDQADAAPKNKGVVGFDRYGDPLPAGALARLGTTRMRHASWVNAVAVSPDGKLVASAGDDNLGRLWNPTTGEEVCRLANHTRSVRAVCFSPDGKTLVSGGGSDWDNDDGRDDGMIRIWDVAAGKELRAFKAHDGTSVCSVAVSPDGKI